jgi:uracil-DNA glycosylase
MRDVQKDMIDSYLDWWTAAGLADPANDDACVWLEPLRPDRVTEPTVPVRSAPSAVVQPKPAPTFVPLDLPKDFDAFETWLRETDGLPGATWGPVRLCPTGPQNSALMVITDMPDLEDAATGHLFAGAVGDLFDAMLGAIGLSRSGLRIASIALTRPPGGRWDDAIASDLRDIALHHISVAAPARVLIVGQQTCRLLTGEDVPADGHGLRNINHYGVTTAAVAIHHPRLLINRQALKRGAWTALKQLREPA